MLAIDDTNGDDPFRYFPTGTVAIQVIAVWPRMIVNKEWPDEPLNVGWMETQVIPDAINVEEQFRVARLLVDRINWMHPWAGLCSDQSVQWYVRVIGPPPW